MSSTQSTGGTLSPARIGALAALTTFGALAGATALLLDDVALGLLFGALSGAGTYFLVPYAIRLTSDGETDGEDNLARGFHPGAAGYAVSSTGIVALALTIVFEDPLLAIGGAVALAAVEYTVVSRVLPR